MSAEVRWISTFVIIFNIYNVLSTDPHRKFEYKYSFKPPYLAQKDGSVPFWEYGGNAIASAENVRVAPSMRSQKGAIWTKAKTNFDWWHVDVIFRITGRGRIGADGLAFWYTENKGAYDGQVFGSSDKWVGLGVFFDSFDNDNKHNNPYIMAVVNDGTKEFDHANDGTSQMLSGCVKDFRNKPFPTRAKIEYYMNTLTVLFHNGMTNIESDFEICLRVENLTLPKNGYFGISAATGGLADDHDVLHFLTTSLYPPGHQPVAAAAAQVTPEEEKKLSQEYAEYQMKFEHQKEEFKREHPGVQVKDQESEFEDWFESDSQRELKQIYSVQSQILEQVKFLSQKLDEVVGRQVQSLSLLSNIHSTGVQQHIPPQGQIPGQLPPQPIMMDSIKRHEVDALLSNQNQVIAAAREIRSFLSEIHSRTEKILEKQERGTAQVTGYDTMSVINEIRESLHGVKRDTEAAAQRVLSTGPSLSTCPSCVTPLILLLAIAAHLIIMFVYFLYRDNKEAQAKKFY